MTQVEMENLIKLPLNLILANWNYKEDRAKSSKNSIKLKNENDDSVIITRNNKGHYLYWNPKEENDRGNIFNFCKNRGIEVKDLLENKDLSKLQTPNAHTLIPNNFKRETLEIVENFKEFENLQSNNYFQQERAISNSLLKSFSSQIKMDKRGNICIPTFIFSTLPNGKEYYPQVGYQAYLKNPITKDRSGNPYTKPLKQICYGAKGLEILNFNPNLENKSIQNIIITESSIDSLSLFERLGLDKQNTPTLLCATNGSVTQSHIDIFQSFDKGEGYLGERFKNARVILGFDNDEAGNKNLEKCQECFKKLKTEVVKPFLKDFNDDLMIVKILEIENPKNSQDFKENLNDVLGFLNQRIEYFLKGKDSFYPHFKEQYFKESLDYAIRASFVMQKAQPQIAKTLQSSLEKNIECFNAVATQRLANEKNKPIIITPLFF